jgi:hypothetical protein
MFSRTEENWSDGQVHLVDEPSLQVLPDRRHSAADANVLSTGSRHRLLKGGADAVGDKMEYRAAFHYERRPRVRCEDEHRRVVRRLLTPPSSPRVVWPRPPNRSKHVPAHDPRADGGHTARGKVVVNPRRSTVTTKHLPEGARSKQPLMQRLTSNPERMLEILVWACTVAIDGNGEAMYSESCPFQILSHER